MTPKARRRHATGATPKGRPPSDSKHFSSRSVHAGLRRLFHRPPSEPLRLTKTEYEAAEIEFVVREMGRLFKRESVELTLNDATPWREISVADIQKLEMCRMRMAFALDGDTYEIARKEFDVVVRGWIPKRRKRSQVRRPLLGVSRSGSESDSFPLAQFLARKLFFWAIMRGEFRALGKDPTAVARIYGYLECVQRPDFKARLNGFDRPSELADQDAVSHFGFDLEPASLRRLIDGELSPTPNSGA